MISVTLTFLQFSSAFFKKLMNTVGKLTIIIFFLQLRVVTGQLFLPELVVFKTMLWLKGFTLGFPGSNTQSFMISAQDLEKFPPLPDPKIYKWSILV